MNPAPGESSEWSPELAKVIKTLWGDPSIKRIYAERDRLFALNDGAG